MLRHEQVPVIRDCDLGVGSQHDDQYTRNADSALRQNKELTASAEDAAEAWAQFFDPWLESWKGALGEGGDALGDLNKFVQEFSSSSGDAKDGTVSLSDAVTAFTPALFAANTVFGLWNKHVEDSKQPAQELLKWAESLTGEFSDKRMQKSLRGSTEETAA